MKHHFIAVATFQKVFWELRCFKGWAVTCLQQQSLNLGNYLPDFLRHLSLFNPSLKKEFPIGFSPLQSLKTTTREDHCLRLNVHIFHLNCFPKVSQRLQITERVTSEPFLSPDELKKGPRWYHHQSETKANTSLLRVYIWNGPLLPIRIRARDISRRPRITVQAQKGVTSISWENHLPCRFSSTR